MNGTGSNFKSAVRYNLRNLIDNGWEIEQNITETGRERLSTLIPDYEPLR